MKNRIFLLLVLISSAAIQAQDISPIATPPGTPRAGAIDRRLSTQDFAIIEALQQEPGHPQEIMSELDHCKTQLSAPENQEKITKGKELLRILFKLTPTRKLNPATPLSKLTSSIYFQRPKELSDIELNLYNPTRKKEFAEYIMWALYDIAAKQKNKYFTEGTFKIEDTGLNLKHYLENIPGVYKRLSTHFNEFKENEWTDLHNGLDLDKLPCDKKHILFDELSDRLTFIKPENYGLEKIDHIIGHIEELIVAKARKIDTLRALFNLAPDNAQGWSKERTPKDILSNYKKLITEIEVDKDTREELITLANKFGIQKIVPTLQSYMTDYRRRLEKLKAQNSNELNLSGSWHAVPEADEIKADQLRDLLLEKLNKIEVFLQKSIGEQDNPEMRSGGEIVISRKNMEDALADLQQEQPAQTVQSTYEDID